MASSCVLNRNWIVQCRSLAVISKRRRTVSIPYNHSCLASPFSTNNNNINNNNKDDGKNEKAFITEKNQSKELTRDSLYRLAQLSREEWTLIALAAGTLGVTSSTALIVPFASGHLVDYTIQSTASGGGAFSPFVLATGVFGLTAVAGGGVYLRTIWLARAGNRIVARLKQKLFGSILQQESEFLDQQSTGDLLSRLTNDAHLVQSAVTTHAVSALRGCIMSVGSIGMLLYTSPTLAAVSCASLPPIFVLSRRVGQRLSKQQEEVQKLQGEATSLAEQSLASMDTVKQFAAEAFETFQYRNAIAGAHRKSYETANMQAQLEVSSHIAGNAAILGVLGYGGSLVLDGAITAGDLSGFIMYSLMLATNLSGLTSTYGDIVRAAAASDRVFEILDREPKIPSKMPAGTFLQSIDKEDPLLALDEISTLNATTDGSYAIPENAASIHIQGLNFRYPSRPDLPILRNFDLSVAPGESVALVGGSGSGKTTIGKLLTRLYDAENKDAICINDKPISDYDPYEVRRMVGIVSQEPTLFRGTIKDNIRYGEWDRNLTEEEITRAARLSHVLDFAENFPEGLDTMVGSRGVELSGGQRQRIVLARVLAKNPPIIVLDEATSALDAHSEHLVQQTLQSMFQEGGRTIVSIAHRLSTIRNSSRIAVLQEGTIVQTGTFEELSSLDGPFRNLMKTQLVGSK